MDNTAIKIAKPAKIDEKQVRKELSDKLDAALVDHKSIIGEEKLGKHIKKMSKTLAEEIVKNTNKAAGKKAKKK
jgi:hypothetical protein